jgi:hypothetical protein
MHPRCGGRCRGPLNTLVQQHLEASCEAVPVDAICIANFDAARQHIANVLCAM